MAVSLVVCQSLVLTCVLPRTLSSYCDRTFAAAGLRSWNSLPVQLCNPDITYGLFRWQLRGHVFQEAWTRRSVTSDMRRLRKHLLACFYKWLILHLKLLELADWEYRLERLLACQLINTSWSLQSKSMIVSVSVSNLHSSQSVILQPSVSALKRAAASCSTRSAKFAI